MIFETIITSINAAGEPHVAPFGIQYIGEHIIISPYKPSITLDNILASKVAVMNLSDDVRIFAGALTNRTPWQLLPTNMVKGFRLANCLTHVELNLLEIHDNTTRPQLIMQKVAQFNHQPFAGFNRAQTAVIELAVLVSRLHLLPYEKIQAELQYLQIAINKTAGANELAAWGWLIEKIDAYYAASL